MIPLQTGFEILLNGVPMPGIQSYTLTSRMPAETLEALGENPEFARRPGGREKILTLRRLLPDSTGAPTLPLFPDGTWGEIRILHKAVELYLYDCTLVAQTVSSDLRSCTREEMIWRVRTAAALQRT